MALKLYNTLTRRKESFKPIKRGRVSIYSCGPTVYSFAHIGNLRAYIAEDILRRALEYNNLKVKHIMNITDVGHLTSDADTGEDKIEKAASQEHKSAWEIAEFYTKAFKEDLKNLNILFPSIWCKATYHIKEQISLVQQLEKKGYTYIIPNDGIYFDTTKLKDYGKLANLRRESLKAGARIALSEGKKNPTDFALWKFSPPNSTRQMEWSSPWSPKGFPGWHIECSAMSMKYLGPSFDIHCGGIDHIPVHHTNEIAQSEAVTGKKFVNYWFHVEFLVINKEKMAKSLGNLLTLNELIQQGFSPLAYRYFCLQAHYRSQLSFSIEAIKTASSSLSSLYAKMQSLIHLPKSKENKKLLASLKNKFISAVNDDLDTPKALSTLWETLNSTLSPEEKKKCILEFDKVLGLRIKDVIETKIPREIWNLAEQRQKARSNKDYITADSIREKINSLGFIIEDTSEGFILKKK